MLKHLDLTNVNALVRGNTLLFHACYYNAIELVPILLDKGADPLEMSLVEHGYPLQLSIMSGPRCKDLFVLLFNTIKTAKVFQRQCQKANTALHAALKSD